MDLQPNLESELLRIRPLKAKDFKILFKVAEDQKIWEQHPCKRYLKQEFQKFFQESIESKGALVIQDKATGKIIGSSRFKLIPGYPDGVEIGWTFLDRKYWGGKYNSAIKKLMIDHAFKHVNNILFYVHKNNWRSRKAVEKIGGEKLLGPEPKRLLKTGPDNIVFIIRKQTPE